MNTQAENERLREGLALLLSWVKNWDVPFLDDDEWRETDGPKIEALLEQTPMTDRMSDEELDELDDLQIAWGSIAWDLRAALKAERQDNETLRQRVVELEKAFYPEMKVKLDALESRLEAVRGLLPGWKEGDFDLPDYTRGKMDGRHECAKQLLAVLGD